MKKKILVSMILIGLLAVAAGIGTYAYFSDTEQVGGNHTITVGTLDIVIGGISDTFGDLKPCYTDYMTFIIYNVGNNPVDVWKHLKSVKCEDAADDGCYLPPWILYDLKVEVYFVRADPDPSWWQGIYDGTEGVTVKDIISKHIYLGMIPVGGHMIVTQSYHLKAETGNWAQGDKMNFDIEVIAKQLIGELTLENKNDEWTILYENDGIYGELTYDVRGPTFDFSFTGTAPIVDADYDLIYYPDPWPGNGLKVLGTGHSDGTGAISITDNVELSTNLPAAGDANHPHGAKIWLVLSSDHDGTQMTAWQPSSYLFETGLILYTDTNG